MARFIHLINIFYCFNFVSAKVSTPSEVNPSQDRIIDCAIDIANNNFNYVQITVVLSKDVEGKFVDHFLKSYKGTVILETKKEGQSPTQVVVLGDSYKSFLKILSKLKPDLKGRTLLSGGAKFLILLLGNDRKIERITKILWSYHATDALIITNDYKNRTAINTYFPYKDYLNCQNTEPTVLSYWKGNDKQRSQTRNMYLDKVKNMHGCPLYISTNKLYHPATEQKIPLEIIKKEMIRLLRDIMNFTPIISTRDYVSIDSDRAKNWSDSLNDVIAGLANISTCSIPLGIDRIGLLGYTMPYFRVRLAWLAPPIGTGPVWWRLLSPLNGYLWLILLVILFFVTSLPFALKLKTVKKFTHRHFRNIHLLQGVVFRIWGVMLGQPIRVAPRRFRDFYIISIWVWFTFVVRSAYQSVLIGALKTDTIVGAFTELKETIDEGYRFGGRGGILAHFDYDPLIREGFEIIPEDRFEGVFQDVIEGRSKFVLATSLEYSWAYCFAHGKKENECGHVLPDSIMTVPLVVWMKCYSPFVWQLDSWIPRFIESGLLEKNSVTKPPCCMLKSLEPTALNRHQTLSCFLCLFLGYAISFAVFCLELLRHKTKKQKQVKKNPFQMIK